MNAQSDDLSVARSAPVAGPAHRQSALAIRRTRPWPCGRRAGAALRAFLVASLAACGSAPPAPPKQVLEYERHTSVGLEKHAQGYIAQARGAFLRALNHAEVDDSGERIASALINLGGIELLLDDAESAGRAYGRAVREARAVKAAGLEWQAQNGLAEATRRLGQAAKALDLYATRPDPGKGLPETLALSAEVGRARALADLGRTVEAIEVLDRVDAAGARALSAGTALAASQHARARTLLLAGQLDQALAAAGKALDRNRALHYPPSVGEDHRLIAEILVKAGRPAEAAEHRSRASTIFSHTGQTTRMVSVRPAPPP
jgi:tetratricopeptide (TPR) repeat protein